MGPIEKLMDEHRIILKGIGVLENGILELEKSGIVSSVFFDNMIDFIRGYSDKYHHAKEEDILFVRMGKAGFPTEQGPIAVMLSDHDQGRGFVAEMEKSNRLYSAGNKSAVEGIVENGRAYGSLLKQHILKEDTILYPMAVDILGEAGIAAMKPDFDRVESEQAGIEKKYIALLSELKY